MKRHARAIWHGNLNQGSGALTTESQALADNPYSFNTRFENLKGTNPEELIAAAHAGCFSMALALQLSTMELTAETIETTASVHLEKTSEGWSIPAIHLDVAARVPNAERSQLLQAAETAKLNCPVSRVLNAKITMEARLLMDRDVSPEGP